MSTKKKLYPYVHPLKPVSYGLNLPEIIRGEGIYIQDTQGKVYIDGISGLWNVSMGYGNPKIREAIINQLDEIPYVNPIQHSNPTTVRFAELLLELVPENIVNVVYTCTGSESTELAIKIARKYNQLRSRPHKNKIATLDLSYHGTYYGSMSISGVDRVISEDYGPNLTGMLFLPTPVKKYPNKDNSNTLEEIEEELHNIFNREGQNIAALIMEPVLGSGGSIPLPIEYVQMLKEFCQEHDILLVIDEVATGFGRTGKMFGFEHFNIEPDLICLSKGINNGYLPLGATLISNKIYEAFADQNTQIDHLSTQNGNPLACAAGIGTLQLINDTTLLNHVTNIGEYLRSEIHHTLYDHKNYSEIRGKGLMMGIELVKNKKSYDCLSYENISELVQIFTQKGLIVYPFYNHPRTTGIHLFPPFTLTKEEADEIVMIIKKVFNQVIF
ncbi:daptide-type RiPP biosynthesis aminotransferase [Paucisalibacillus sp. EB02]|uniref:daptide-type RiPP biosynthesis aminotransferase n=1 Tax=Paucisalibacillus sp. EB02 TaxID=1347087 RepID=UPI0004B674A4|nr:daptide-type RiPP biosynthesis aminotransferase [Paucisalibacillus sp. EB02]